MFVAYTPVTQVNVLQVWHRCANGVQLVCGRHTCVTGVHAHLCHMCAKREYFSHECMSLMINKDHGFNYITFGLCHFLSQEIAHQLHRCACTPVPHCLHFSVTQVCMLTSCTPMPQLKVSVAHLPV